MPTNAQVSQTDLQRYLEQLYKGYYSNASPALQGGFDNIASYDAGVDSQPNSKPMTSYTPPKVPLAPVGTLDRMNFPQQQLPAPPPFTPGTSSHMPPGGYPIMVLVVQNNCMILVFPRFLLEWLLILK